jgi:hypothetical protein
MTRMQTWVMCQNELAWKMAMMTITSLNLTSQMAYQLWRKSLATWEKGGWIQDSVEIASTGNLVSLAGKSNAFKQRDEEKLVMSEGQHEGKSDEGEEDHPHIAQTSIGQASKYAWRLYDLMEHHPESFSPHLASE